MARHRWEYPSEFSLYEEMLAEGHARPEFEVVREVDVGRGGFNGAGHAWEVYDRANGVRCLQSYSTIVSVVRGGRAVDIGYWSRTTALHQNRFRALVAA